MNVDIFCRTTLNLVSFLTHTLLCCYCVHVWDYFLNTFTVSSFKRPLSLVAINQIIRSEIVIFNIFSINYLVNLNSVNKDKTSFL